MVYKLEGLSMTAFNFPAVLNRYFYQSIRNLVSSLCFEGLQGHAVHYLWENCGRQCWSPTQELYFGQKEWGLGKVLQSECTEIHAKWDGFNYLLINKPASVEHSQCSVAFNFLCFVFEGNMIHTDIGLLTFSCSCTWMNNCSSDYAV